MGTTAHREFDSSQIPVDSAVLFRTSGMDEFQLCHVLNVSTSSLEVMFTHTLPLNTLITFAVGNDSSPDGFRRAVGEVRHREPVADDWRHIITSVGGEETWPSSFLFDVICSCAEDSDELVEKFHSKDEARPHTVAEPGEELTA